MSALSQIWLNPNVDGFGLQWQWERHVDRTPIKKMLTPKYIFKKCS